MKLAETALDVVCVITQMEFAVASMDTTVLSANSKPFLVKVLYYAAMNGLIRRYSC